MTSFEPLARVIAASWATSTVAPGLSTCLTKLIPGLTFASLAVSNPHRRRWSLMEASNFAKGSKLELTLLDPQQSAAGLALNKNKLIQSGLSAGVAQLPLQLGDVAKMAQEAPDTKHFVCLPFKPASANGGPMSCTLEGALLIGVKDDCMPTKRQLAVLIMLSQLLPAALYIAATATGILETVDFMTGATPYQCPCCTQEDDECDSFEDSEEGPSSPCGGDDKRNPPGNPPPAHSLLVPTADGSSSAEAADMASSSSLSRGSSETQMELPSLEGGEGPSGITMAGDADELRRMVEDQAPLKKCQAHRKESSVGELGKEDVAEKAPRSQRSVLEFTTEKRHAIWANFVDPALELEYLKWHNYQHVKVDRLFALLLLTALGIVAFCNPFQLLDYNPWGLVMTYLFLGPLLAVLERRAFIAQRERVMVIFRILLVAFVNLVSIPSYQAKVAHEQLAKAATFWMLSGAQSLLISSLGWQVRFRLQIPLQFACMAIAAWHLPSMCSSCYPEMTQVQCQGRSWRLLVGAGLVLPSGLLRLMEGKSRDTFLQELRAVSA